MTPAFSIVIPTRDREAALSDVLAALGRQQAPPSFEVVVVDDGSTSGGATGTDRFAGRGLDLTVLRQEHQGPAAARNRGIAAARGDYVAFLGDDTVPAPGWLAAHANAHASGSGPQPLAVVGHTDWHPAIRTTPFLRYINTCGLQFGYGVIDKPDDLPFEFFYGSNVSLPRRLLLEEPFSVLFTQAAWEDTELGYRLKTRKGLRLVYEPAARAWHRHATTFASFSRRQYKAGCAAFTIFQLHPALGPLVGFTPQGPVPIPAAGTVRRKSLAIRLLEHAPVSLPEWWMAVLRYHYIRGLWDGWRDASAERPATRSQNA